MRTPITLSALAIAGLLTAQVPQLWGVTTSGGAHGLGTIFHVDGDGSDYATVFSFDTIDGGSPEGGLCYADGRLYGMATLYGANSMGTLFSYDPNGAGFHKIMDFNATNGGLAWGSMIRGTDGLLYGTTYQGGGSGGSIFRLDPANDNYTILRTLDQATDGGAVTDRLYQGSDGVLFGTCAYGGANGHGTVFRYVPGTNTFNKLSDFDGTNGSTPYGRLCEGTDGLLYGMTYEGGTQNKGVLYSVDPGTGDLTKRLDFTGANGQSPWGSLERAQDGTLYGSTTLGGPSTGSLFSFDPTTNTLTTLHSFTGVDGGLLFGAAIIGTDGALYGAGSTGGDTFQGMLYRYDPDIDQATTLHSFTDADGLSPRSELVQANTVTGIAERAAGPQWSVFPNPTKGDLTILLDEADVPTATLQFVNALGQVVRTERPLQARWTVHTGLAAGTYTLVLQAAKGRSVTSLVVQ